MNSKSFQIHLAHEALKTVNFEAMLTGWCKYNNYHGPCWELYTPLYTIENSEWGTKSVTLMKRIFDDGSVWYKYEYTGPYKKREGHSGRICCYDGLEIRSAEIYWEDFWIDWCKDCYACDAFQECQCPEKMLNHLFEPEQ